MMLWTMPLIPNFEAAQKEARKLLRNLQRKDARSAELYRQFDAIDVLPARLSDAQYLVARRYGFGSWLALKAFLTSRTRSETRPTGQPDEETNYLWLSLDC